MTELAESGQNRAANREMIAAMLVLLVIAAALTWLVRFINSIPTSTASYHQLGGTMDRVTIALAAALVVLALRGVASGYSPLRRAARWTLLFAAIVAAFLLGRSRIGILAVFPLACAAAALHLRAALRCMIDARSGSAASRIPAWAASLELLSAGLCTALLVLQAELQSLGFTAAMD